MPSAEPYPTPAAVESAFYQAFEAADLETLLAVWDEGSGVACIHPLGARIEGGESVRESWRRILRSGPRLRFEVRNVRATVVGDMAVHLVDEVVTVVEEGREAFLHATNVYRRTARGWRMVLHHASPAPSSRRAAPPLVH
jgi:ketosteroid isomerase-like protein